MGKKIDPKEMITAEELLLSNVMEQEALINLLEKKGIITKSELLAEIKRPRVRKRDNE